LYNLNINTVTERYNNNLPKISINQKDYRKEIVLLKLKIALNIGCHYNNRFPF